MNTLLEYTFTTVPHEYTLCVTEIPLQILVSEEYTFKTVSHEYTFRTQFFAGTTRCIPLIQIYFFAMWWLRLVGASKLKFPFAKEPYKRDYILRKRPIILRSLLIVATPYKTCAFADCCTHCKTRWCVCSVAPQEYN